MPPLSQRPSGQIPSRAHRVRKLRVTLLLLVLLVAIVCLSSLRSSGTRVQAEASADRNLAFLNASFGAFFFSAPITVDSTDDVSNDSDGKCTLREAISSVGGSAANPDIEVYVPPPVPGECNGRNGSTTIKFAGGLSGTIELLSSLGQLDGDIQIEGPGANLLTVRRKSTAATNFPVFLVGPAASVNISGLIISGGTGKDEGGATFRGGGVYIDGGTLSLNNCTVTDNHTGGAQSSGGGIYNKGGTLSLTNSTVSNNSANLGGGIYSEDTPPGKLTITGSTISFNSAQIGGGIYAKGGTLFNSTITNGSANSGGGIYQNGGTLTLTNCTITQNFTTATSSVHFNSGTLLIKNSIVAGQLSGGNFHGGFTDLGNNVTTGDPKLGPLQNNGGPTLTRAPLNGSRAIDAGDSCVTEPSRCGDPNLPQLLTDQRGAGFRRKMGGQVDSGAFELQVAPDLGSASTPTLGNYQDTSIPLSTNTTVTPDAVPTNTTSINVSSATDFKGKLEGDPVTGVVRVTDAHPAGTFTVTVKAFNGDAVTTTATFTLTVRTPATCSPVSFASTGFGFGASPAAVAVGDFNGDGKQDLATGNHGTDNVSVLLGDGAGGFSAGATKGVGDSPLSVAVGDFNGDGKQDLAVGNYSSDNVSILLGDGAANFSAATNFTADNGPRLIAVGDFNGDGRPDLAVINELSNNLSVLLGDGAGSFGGATNFGVGAFPLSVAVGDFNGDGKQDLATANGGSNSVSVLVGDGAGGFSGATNFTVINSPLSAAVGDFNNDGQQDFATANGGSSDVSILLGNGAGSFGAATNFGAVNTPRLVAVGDFNGDGRQDVVTANEFSNNVSILLGDGAGGLSAATNFAVGSRPFSVAVGDFNGDGQQDLATANVSSSNVSIMLRNCAPPPTPTPTPSPTPSPTPTPTPSPTPSPSPSQTPSTSLSVSPATGSFGGQTILAAILTSNGTAVTGKTVNFTINGNTVGFGTTEASTGTAYFILMSVPGVSVGTYPGSVGAVFAGDTSYSGSSGSNDLTITRASSSTTINCTAGAPFNYTGSAITPCTATATGAGGLNVSVSPITYTNNVSVGNAPASATYAGDLNHDGSTGTGGFTINPVSVNVPTSSGSNVTTTSANGTTLTFNNVTTAGTTTIAAIDPVTAGTLPAGYFLTSNSLAFEIQTSASYAGLVTVAFHVPSISDPAQFALLRVLHGENGVLVDRTVLAPNTPAPDFATHMIYARVSSLSPFVITMANPGTPVPPMLGNYPDTSISLSSNTTVTPDAAPTNAAGINVFTSTDFMGTLSANAATGVVSVTNAHPAGTYTVKVKAFNSDGVTALRTFTLIVTTPATCLPVNFATSTEFRRRH